MKYTIQNFKIGLSNLSLLIFVQNFEQDFVVLNFTERNMRSLKNVNKQCPILIYFQKLHLKGSLHKKIQFFQQFFEKIEKGGIFHPNKSNIHKSNRVLFPCLLKCLSYITKISLLLIYCHTEEVYQINCNMIAIT